MMGLKRCRALTSWNKSWCLQAIIKSHDCNKAFVSPWTMHLCKQSSKTTTVIPLFTFQWFLRGSDLQYDRTEHWLENRRISGWKQAARVYESSYCWSPLQVDINTCSYVCLLQHLGAIKACRAVLNLSDTRASQLDGTCVKTWTLNICGRLRSCANYWHRIQV